VKDKKSGMFRWFVTVWSEAQDESTRAYRKHIRGLFVCWAITAVAMAMIETFPNEANLSMYGLLMTRGLPWQQQGLAAIELAAPLLMVWHLIGLRLWGKKSLI